MRLAFPVPSRPADGRLAKLTAGCSVRRRFDVRRMRSLSDWLRGSPPVHQRAEGRASHAALRRQPVDDVQRGAVPGPLRRCAPRPGSRAWSSCSRTSIPAAELRERLSGEGLTQVLFNMPPGDWAKGERGMASLPGRQAEFRESGEEGAGLCRRAGLPADALHGRDRAGRTCRRRRRRRCMPRTSPGRRNRPQPAGVRLVIEPINHRDMPGYFLNTQAQGAAIVEAIGRDRLGPAVRRLSCAGDRGRHHQAHGAVHAGDRAYADRRRAGPQRAGDRGDRLGLRVPPDGRARL